MVSICTTLYDGEVFEAWRSCKLRTAQATWQALYVSRSIEWRSRNHCCRGKAISITYLCACVSRCVGACACSLVYPACNVRAPYFAVICGLSGCTIFIDIITYTVRFSEKMLLNIKYVLWFSLQLLSETFLIPRIQRDIVINVKTSSCKVPVILVGF